MAASPPPANRHEGGDVIDDEWDKFQASGCPDFWLLTKYMQQAAAHSFSQPGRPHAPSPGAASPPRALSAAAQEGAAAGGMELQKQQPQQQPLPQQLLAHEQCSCATPDALPTPQTQTRPPAPGAAHAHACGLKGLIACGGCVAAPGTAGARQPADQQQQEVQ